MATRETKISILIEARNRAEAALAQLNKQLGDSEKSVENLSGAMAKVGTVGAVAFAGLAAATVGFVKAGADFEQTQVAFTTMIGSAEEANALLKDMAKFASATPFQLTDLERSTKSLLAYGVASKKIIPTLKTLGDIAAGVGMDKLPQLILAFGQVKAATKLTGAELRQFSEAGVPLLGALAQQMGKTEAQILDMVSAGQIGFPAVEQALQGMTAEGGKFFNLMAAQSTTLGGLWSNLQDQFSLTARTIGTELLPIVKPLVIQLIDLMGWVQGFVREHPKLTAALLLAATAFAGITAALVPLAMALPGLTIAFGALTPVLAGASVASLGVAATFLGMAALIAAAVASLWVVYKNWEDLWGAFKVVAATVAYGIVGIFEWMGNFVIDVINGLIEQVNKLLKKLASIPMIGDKFSGLQIGKIDRLDLASKIDPVAMYGDLVDNGKSRSAGQMLSDFMGGEQSASQFYGPVQAGARGTGPTFNFDLSKSVFLDPTVAEDIGDQIMQRLKLSNPI